ncbi:MAG: zinc-dependent metalloprotease [Pseudobdellovibrio sp.]
MRKGLQQMKQSGLTLLTLGIFILSACTKSIPYKDVPASEKEHNISKSLIDTKNEYLMSVSMQNASMSSSDALPFSSSENKRVKVKLDQESLNIIETESDSRYSANTANDKLVLEVPIEHVQYQCAKDKFGECTNSEEEAKDIDWKIKTGIKVKLDKAKTTELNLLPILEDKTFGGSCYEEVSTKLISSDITADAINFSLERTFVTNIRCVKELDKLKDATVTAVYHYSLVKLSSVLTKDFKVVSYPDGSKDESSFGFFSTKRIVLDVDNSKTEKSTVQVMNHWDPRRTELPYYLSDEFAKPENKLVKDLTYKTVANINQGLVEAGVNFKINLHDPEGKVPGDIRNSMIVLVEDPINSGVIGYGPQTEDPVTGEIISARTIMFLGTIKQGVQRTYNDIIREKRSSLTMKAIGPKLKLAESLTSKVKQIKMSGQTAGISAMVTAIAEAKKTKVDPVGKVVKPLAATSKVSNIKEIDFKALKKSLKGQRNSDYVGTDTASKIKAKIKYLQEVKNCALSPGIDSFSYGISKKLMDQFPDDAKPWVELNDKEKEHAMQIILPEVWVATLIHELGHNLGLRHNFEASEDKENFFSTEELAKVNVDHDIPASSVMDYIDDLRALPVLGKYDIAALRFGYLRTAVVETINDETNMVIKSESVDLTDTTLEDAIEKMQSSYADKDQIKVDLKKYGYCTDEHVGANAGCKRFDLGTSLTEITQNIIKDYEDGYKRRNFRNGRISMSMGDDLGYASAVNSRFLGLRLMMESVERIIARSPVLADPNHPAWTQYAWLADLKQASVLSGVFLTKVLLVPDVICAIAKNNDLTTVTEVVGLKDIDPTSMSCFDIKLSEAFAKDHTIVAQAGKMFNSLKDSKSKNAYVDQIDIRGIWPDKIVAAKNLFQRQIGSFTFDRNSDNFLNTPELRNGIAATMKALMLNNIVDDIAFTTKDGTVASLELNYDLYDSQVIEAPLYNRTAQALGVDENYKTQLQQVLALEFSKGMLDKSGAHADDNPLALAMIVHKQDPQVDVGFHAKSVIFEGARYVVSTEENVLANEIMDNMKVSNILDQLTRADIIKIFNAKVGKEKMPVDATAVDKLAWGLALEPMADYLNSIIKPTSFYSRLLSILPTPVSIVPKVIEE